MESSEIKNIQGNTYARPISCDKKQDLLMSSGYKILYPQVRGRYSYHESQPQDLSPWTQTQDASFLCVGSTQSIR